MALPPARGGEVVELARPDASLVVEDVFFEGPIEVLQHVGGAARAHIGIALAERVPTRAPDRPAFALPTSAAREPIRTPAKWPRTRTVLFAKIVGLDTLTCVVSA